MREDLNVMRTLTAVTAVGLAAAALSACAGGTRQPSEQNRPPTAVTVVAAAMLETAERLEAGGVVAAQESATVSSRIVSPVVRVHVNAGDQVRTGDVLVTLDAEDSGEHV